MNESSGPSLPEHERMALAESLYVRLFSIMTSEGICVIEVHEVVTTDDTEAVGQSYEEMVDVLVSQDPIEKFKTLVHEYAHESLHWKHDTMYLPFAIKETQAETVAFAVADAFGLEANSNGIADVLKGYGSNQAILRESIPLIVATAQQIILKLQLQSTV